jgi:hypothetical protein
LGESTGAAASGASLARPRAAPESSNQPMRAASSAPTDRPVKMSSFARGAPTARGSRCVPPAPGITPSRVSGKAKRAPGPATRRSHASASSAPPPSAKPSTAATVGAGSAASAAKAARRSATNWAVSCGEEGQMKFREIWGEKRALVARVARAEGEAGRRKEAH